MKPQILIASLTPGSGKTSFALGLCRMLKNRGVRVQSYKCGPDFVDSQLLSIANDKQIANLDNWLSSTFHIQHVYNNYGESADICIVDGSSALFDGYELSHGSCSEIAELLHLPVILVINARISGYSIAAMILGFKLFNPKIKIAGVVFNQTTSSAQYKYLSQACIVSGTECFGYIPFISEEKLPTRHSAITVNVKAEINSYIDRFAEKIAKSVDVDKILNICNRTFPCQYSLPYSSDYEDQINLGVKKINIAVAKDVAFCYIHKENIRHLSTIGNIIYFSPLYSNSLPECDMLYIPNGVPELFARQLHRCRKMLAEIHNFAENGGMILAEGNSVALLADNITIRDNGTPYEMASVFPFSCDTIGLKLHTGYVSIACADTLLRGNEYHYCNITGYSDGNSYIKVYNIKGIELTDNIFRYKNCIASLPNIYWGDNDILSLWRKTN